MSEPDCPRFERILERRGVLVADGAMGTTLFDLGLEPGGCPEMLNVERPELVGEVHRAFIDAGADLILTNTFGGNRRRLALHGLEERSAELNAAAVRIAREAADAADREVLVAGSIGPTGDLFEPFGPLTHADGVAVFCEQAAALVGAGVDVLWIETLSSWEELAAATEAASGFGIPVSATLSFDTNGHTMMGIAPHQLGSWAADHPLAAVGANCGIGPGDGVAAALDIATAAPGATVVVKANCGMPAYTEGFLEYPIGPEGMVDYTELALRSGARIVGACCGSTPDHVAVIRRELDAFTGGEPPDHAEIVRRLEASERPSPGTGSAGGSRSRSGRRRRRTGV